MPDITMCRDNTCHHKHECYRFTAKPDDRWQSYFSDSPREGNEHDECIYFWQNKEDKDESNT